MEGYKNLDSNTWNSLGSDLETERVGKIVTNESQKVLYMYECMHAKYECNISPPHIVSHKITSLTTKFQQACNKDKTR